MTAVDPRFSGPAHRSYAPVWCALAVLVAIEGWGFATTRPFAQTIWTDVGFARFVFFTECWGAVSLLAFVLPAPAAIASLLAGVVGYSVLVLGLRAALAPLLVLAAFEALGARVVRRDDDELQDRLLHTLVGLAIAVWTMAWLVRVPVNGSVTYLGLLAVPLWVDRRGVARRWHRTVRSLAGATLPPIDRLAALALGYVLAMHWLLVLKPEIGADALAMHLAIPADVAAHGRLTYEPSRFVWAVMPLGADYAYTVAYGLGGEGAARLLNFAFLLGLVALLYDLVRPMVGRPAGLLLAACFASTPLAALVTSSLFVENQLAFVVLGSAAALWRFDDDGAPRWLRVAALLGGTAMATKFGGVSFVAIGVATAAVVLRRRGRHLPLGRTCLTALALLAVAAAPPYLIAWWKTGNPVFPFVNAVFHSPLFPPENFVDRRFLEPLRPSTLFDLTFHTGRWYEGQNGSFGFQYLLLFPLGILGVFAWPSVRTAGALAFGLGGGLLVAASVPNARYLYPALPFAFVPFAGLLAFLRDAPPRVALAAAVIALTGMNVLAFPSAGYYDKSFYLPPGPDAREAYLAQAAPIRTMIAAFDRAHAGAGVLLANDTAVAELEGRVYEDQWHQWTTQRALRAAPDLDALRRLLAEWQVDFLIASSRRSADAGSPLDELIARCTTDEARAGGTRLLRIEPNCRPPDAPTAVAGTSASSAGITGTITATPNPVPVCGNATPGITTIAWDSRGSNAVEVHVESPDGPLFAASGAGPGSQDTGAWVRSGSTFYLQNVAHHAPLTADNTLATVTVRTAPGACP